MKYKYFNKEEGATDELYDLACGSNRRVNHMYLVSLEEWDFTQFFFSFLVIIENQEYPQSLSNKHSNKK